MKSVTKWVLAWLVGGTLIGLLIAVLRRTPAARSLVAAITPAVGLCVLLVTCVVGVEDQRRRQAIAFFVGWLVPGLGHVVVGKWRKGLFLCTLLAVTYLFGLWLSGWHTVSFDDNPFYHVGQYGSASTSLLGYLLGEPKAFPRDDLPKSWFDPGLLYVCAVGLLNIVVMLSVLDFRDAKPGTTAAASSPGPVPPAKEGAQA